MRKLTQWMAAVWLISLLTGCSNITKITKSYVDDTRVGKPVKNVLVIAVIEDVQIREIFETYFMKRLNVIGVEAISSFNLLSIDLNTAPEKEAAIKEAILKIVDEYGNDAVVITRLAGFEETEVFSRSNRLARNVYVGYYGFYNYGYAWDGAYAPTIYGEHMQISLETRLYDVKTESLIWAGESQTMDPKTTGQAIGQVIDVVMKELRKNGLLPESK